MHRRHLVSIGLVLATGLALGSEASAQTTVNIAALADFAGPYANVQRIERYGQVAHVCSRYEARAHPADTAVLKRGANSIQAAHDGQRWWIVSTIWDIDRAGVAFDLI